LRTISDVEGQPSPAESSDRAIIAASLARPSEFGLLFERHAAVLNRYFVRRIGPVLAEDLTADTFTTAFRLRDRFDDSYEDARPWLFGIATNMLRRQWRTEKRQLRAYARSGVDAAVEETAEAERRVDAARAAPRLADALGSIPRKDREALLLFAWAELSYEEIALALEVPVGTVRSRISRARARLRELLGADGQSEVEPMTAKGTTDG
jgi:RNA polymerase sigma-70 factor (ECF subfamily)